MKKITLFAFLAVSGISFAQSEGTADVNAEIVSPIEINDGTALNFGSINGTGIGGDVTVKPNGNRLFTNTDMEVTSATTVTAGQFSITAGNGVSYDISIPSTVLTGAGTDMNLVFAHDRIGAAKRIGTGAAQELNVGGTLTVNDAQTAGAYEGTVTVTVNYN